MKTVGIILREWDDPLNNIPLYGVRRDLILFLRKYNINIIAIPIVFENINEFEKIKEIMGYCDGIIFPGGMHVRDVDIEIMKYLYKKDKPTFGICLGMQIMGMSFSGGVREKIEKRKS